MSSAAESKLAFCRANRLQDSRLKICDLTQFYSPLSGGVKRYVHEKIRYIQRSPDDEHVLIIPGPKTEMIEAERSRIYSIRSPLLSRTSRYRALLNLRAIEEILEREQPDLIESGDPYQVAWKAIASGAALRIPVVGFYHSHFPEAYLRTTARFLGRTATEFMMDLARRYVRKIYNHFEATLVPSARLGQLLTDWGVDNVHAVDLGVDVEIFRPRTGRRGGHPRVVRHFARTLSSALRRAAGPGKEHADSVRRLRAARRARSAALSPVGGRRRPAARGVAQIAGTHRAS